MQKLSNIDAEINYLLNELSEGIILVDSKKNILFINEAAKLILGKNYTKNKKLDIKFSDQKTSFCSSDNSIYDIQAIPFDDQTGWRLTIKPRKDPNDNMLGDAAFIFSNFFNHPDNAVYLYNCKKERFEYLSPMLSDLFEMHNSAFFNINLKEFSDMVFMSESDNLLKTINMAIAKNESDILHLNLKYAVRDFQKSIWLSDYITISFDSGNQPLFIVGNVTNISSQKIIDKKLVENEKRLQAHLMLAGDAIFEHNLISNRFNYGFNWVQLIGLWPSDIEKLYDSWLELIHPDDYDELKSNYYNFIKSKEDRFKHVCRIKTNTNEYKYFLVKALITDWDETDSPAQVFGIIKNLSQNDLLDSPSSETSTMFDLVVKGSPNGVIIIDKSGEIVGWNNGMELITGIKRNYAIGQYVWNIQAKLTSIEDVDNLWIEQLEVTFKELVRNNPNGIEIAPEITKLKNMDGEIKDIFVRTGTIDIDNNQLIVVYYTDLSDLPQRSINETNFVTTPMDAISDDLNFIIENQSDLIIKLDAKARYLYANPRFCNMIDSDLHELLGQSMLSIIYDDDLHATEKAISALKTPPFFTELEHRIKTMSGWCWIHWTLKNIWDTKLHARTVIATGQDISKIKKLNDEICQIEDDHQQELKNREQQYQSTLDELLELKYSYQQKFEEYDKLITEYKKNESDLLQINANSDKFMSIIAHDIKSPLQGIINVTNYLHNEFVALEKDEIKDLLATINNSSKSLNKLLENLLYWSKLQRNTITYTPEPLHLKKTIQSIIDLFKASTKDKRVSIEIDLPEELMIWSDLNLFNTIFRNLISNAIKFSFLGGKISVALQSDDDLFVTILVQDFGVGIKAELLSQIRTTPGFHTTPGTLNEKGTGLGLALCFELAEKNKGKLSIESLPEIGTTVLLKLPKYC